MGVVNKTFGESWKRGKLITVLAAALLAVLAAVVLAASPAFAQETTSQAPSQGGQYGVSPGEAGTTTVNFALTTNGTPPADATFFAQTVQGIAVQLTDGDGVYTGSYTYNTQAFPEGHRSRSYRARGRRRARGTCSAPASRRRRSRTSAWSHRRTETPCPPA